MKKLLELIKKILGSSGSSSSDSSEKGFTLIELLVVIAVLGVLAAAVLVAVDPVEQLSRGRDSGRKEALASVGRAVEAYYTANAAYPTGATWIDTLVASGDIKVAPTGFGAPGCTGGSSDNNFCLKSDTDSFIVYGFMESKTENTKPSSCAAGTTRWYAYASLLGRAGTICQAGQPDQNFSGTMY